MNPPLRRHRCRVPGTDTLPVLPSSGLPPLPGVHARTPGSFIMVLIYVECVFHSLLESAGAACRDDVVWGVDALRRR